MKVAILGAGRMAALLSARIPNNIRKVVINRHRARAVALADEVGALASDQISAVRGCRFVFLAVPGPAIAGLVQDAAAHLDPDAVLVNMATDLMTDELSGQFRRLRIVAAKVIGHAREMAAGSQGVVLLDHVTDEEAAALGELLSGLGPVRRGPEEQALAANTAVAEAMVRAEADLRAKLVALGLHGDLTEAAVRTMAPGVLRAVTEGDPGPFIQGVLRRLRSG